MSKKLMALTTQINPNVKLIALTDRMKEGLEITKVAKKDFDNLDLEISKLMNTIQKKHGFMSIFSKRSSQENRETAFTRFDHHYRESYLKTQKGLEIIAQSVQEILSSHQNEVEGLEKLKKKEDEGTITLDDYRETFSNMTSLPVLGVNDAALEKLSPGIVSESKKQFKEALEKNIIQKTEMLNLLGTMFGVVVVYRDTALRNYCSYHTVSNPIKTLTDSASAIQHTETDSKAMSEFLILALEISVNVVDCTLRSREERGQIEEKTTASIMEAGFKLKEALEKFSKSK